MFEQKFIIKWFKVLLVILSVSTVSGFLHEAGHYSSAYLFDLNPSMSFQNGGYVSYSKLSDTIPKYQKAITTAIGPIVTFALAVVFFLIWNIKKTSFLLFYFALYNSMWRFNVLIDGSGSDEWKLSVLLNLLPITFSVLSFVISLILVLLLFKKQAYFKFIHSVWVIPLVWIIGMISYRAAFGFISIFMG